MFSCLLSLILLSGIEASQGARMPQSHSSSTSASQTTPQSSFSEIHGSTLGNNVPWHQFREEDQESFLGSSLQSQHSPDSHSDIDWDELDKTLARSSQSPQHNLNTRVESTHQEQSKPSQSHAPKYNHLLKLDTAKLLKEIHSRPAFHGPNVASSINDVVTSQYTMNQARMDKVSSLPARGGKQKAVAAMVSSSQAPQIKRYGQDYWQEDVQDEKQKRILAALRKHWGRYHKAKYEAAYKKVQDLMDEKTELLILASHQETIREVGKLTNPVKENPKKTPKYWPDPHLRGSPSGDIVRRLSKVWHRPEQTARARLDHHYRPYMRDALLGSDPKRFMEVANYIEGKVKAGKLSGSKRLKYGNL